MLTLVTLGFLVLAVSPLPVRAEWIEPGAVPGAIRYRSDAIVIQLRDAPARAARRIPIEALPATTRIERLGAGIDRVAIALGGVWFEREFPDAPAPAARLDAGSSDRPGLAAFYIAHLPPGVDRERALREFRAAPEVEAADPIAIVPVQLVPNDSLWDRAYYFYQPSRKDLHAVEAWDVTQGDSGIVVGVIDTGVLLHHPDLREQIWINWRERGGVPGVDDDGNGYIDDDRGWDFVALDSASQVRPGEDWRDQDNDPNDYVAHGTAVAGLVAATTNNRIGIASAAGKARIMALRAGWSGSLQPSGELDLSYAARAIVYAARTGAHVVNCSFTTIPEIDLVAAANEATETGMTIVAAAGNGQPEHYLPDRDDVIAVAATDREDRLAGFSNRGLYVDVSAPGEGVVTTSITRPGTDSLGYRTPTYAPTASGTSFAAPLAAGAIALIQSERRARGAPLLSPMDAQLRIVDTADDISAMNPDVTGYGTGRINLLRALTDPPGSFAIPAAGHTVGAGVAFTTWTGKAWIAFASTSARLVLAEAKPDATPTVVPLGGAPIGGVAAADLGGGLGFGMFVATDDDRVAGFDATGSPLAGWPVPGPRHQAGEGNQPALGDLDGDGVLEVVMGGHDGRVWAWRASGARMPGFPVNISASGWRIDIALSELDTIPGVEIVAAVSGGYLYTLRYEGSPRLRFVAATEVDLGPIVMRLGSDPEPALIVGEAGNILAYRPNGDVRWMATPPSPQVLPLAVADLDGDGFDELVLTLHPRTIGALDSSGTFRVVADMAIAIPAAYPGTPVIGSVVPGGRGAIVHFQRPGYLVAVDGAGRRVGPLPKPGRAGAWPSIVDLDGDGRSEIVAGSSASDSSIFVYRLGPGSWNESAQEWPTPFGNFARTRSALYAPPIGRVDDVPPAAVSDLATSAIRIDAIDLRWTAPADVGPTGRPHRYELRISREPIDEASFAGASPVTAVPVPGEAGTVEHLTVDGLDESTRYYLALRSRDTGGHISPISNLLIVTTAGVNPARVEDLRVLATSDTSATLAWTASGDDGATGRPSWYRVRAAEQPIDAAGFDLAPIAIDLRPTADAGQLETVALGGLRRGHRYWVVIVAEDEAGNRSTISNGVVVWIGPFAGRSGTALAAGTQPARPPVELYWQTTATGGPRRIDIYDLAGRRMRALPIAAGSEGMEPWDGRDHEGAALPAGLYFARLNGERAARTRIVLLR